MSYALLYYIGYFSLVILSFPYFAFRKQQTNPVFSFFLGICLILIASFYFGFRDIHTGSDTVNYTNYYYQTFRANSLLDYLKMHHYIDIFFYGLLYYGAKWIPLPVFFTLISILFLTSLVLFASSRNKEALFPLLINVLGLFFVFNLNINIVRSAFALSLFFIFLYFREKKKWIGWLFLIAAVTSHITVLIVVIVYFLSKRVKNINLYYCIFFVALMLAIFNLGFATLPFVKEKIAASEKFNNYLHNMDHYKVGFRLNFTVFNCFFILMGYLTYWRKPKPYYFRMYILLTAIFFLWYGIPYSDRGGVYSWLLIPYIILDFINSSYFKKRNITYWIYYSLILVLGLSSFFLVSI